MDRTGLADFLRRRRAALQPEEVGLGHGRRRRTAGLRREEVAALAAMSTDFYTRIEQRRGAVPSEQTVGALARALRLNQDERDHLFQLSGHTPPPRAVRTDHVTPSLLRLLDHLDDAPAQVVSDLGVVLRQNALAEALLGVQTTYTGLRRSIIYRWFMDDPEERGRFPEEDHAIHSRSYVATLRAAHGRMSHDPEADELVDALLAESPEFAALWNRHEVAVRGDERKRIVHPSVGLLTLDCQILTAENLTERLVVFTATPGSEDAERLTLLAVIGTQDLAEPPAAR